MMNTKTTKKAPHFIRTMVALVLLLAMLAVLVFADGSPALAADTHTFTVIARSGLRSRTLTEPLGPIL